MSLYRSGYHFNQETSSSTSKDQANAFLILSRLEIPIIKYLMLLLKAKEALYFFLNWKSCV